MMIEKQSLTFLEKWAMLHDLLQYQLIAGEKYEDPKFQEGVEFVMRMYTTLHLEKPAGLKAVKLAQEGLRLERCPEEYIWYEEKSSALT